MRLKDCRNYMFEDTTVTLTDIFIQPHLDSYDLHLHNWLKYLTNTINN